MDDAVRPKVLNTHETVNALTKHLPPTHGDFLAFYSSCLGGIVTNPAFFQVPLDEHMVHRGHAVFDTCNVNKGKAYGLDFHLNRLLKSANLARIKPAFTKEQLREIILSTIAATQQRHDIFVRYWMSAGRGDFSVSSKQTSASNFFVVVHRYVSKDEYKKKGIAEFVVDVPLKPPLLATIKSNNYLLNALTCEASQDKGGFLGIQMDVKGHVAEGSIANVAILDHKGYFKTPSFGKVLAGTTLQRIFDLASTLKEKGIIQDAVFAELTLQDLLSAKEAYSVGGGFIVPIVCINNETIGDGKPGEVFHELDHLLLQDMETLEHLDEIPYHHYHRGLVRRALGHMYQSIKKLDGSTLLLGWLAVTIAYTAGRVRGGPTFVL